MENKGLITKALLLTIRKLLGIGSFRGWLILLNFSTKMTNLSALLVVGLTIEVKLQIHNQNKNNKKEMKKIG